MITWPSSNGHSAGRAQSGLSAREAFRVLFRHKGKMLLFFSSVVGLLLVALMFYPRTYVSEARVLVRIGKENASLDPTATLGHTVGPLEASRESEINSELEILRSRALLEDVINKIGVDEILGTAEPNGSWMELVKTNVATVASVFSDDVGPLERAIAKLEKDIWVNTPRRSHIVILNARAKDPKLAQEILQAFLDSYMLRHTKVYRTVGSYDFFVEQTELINQRLDEAATKLRNAKNRTGLVSIAGQQLNLQAQCSAIETAMLENERQSIATEAKITELKKMLDVVPADVPYEEIAGYPNFAADTMRGDLYRLQIREKELAARFTDEHPSVKEVRRQVAETQKIFDNEDGPRSQTTRRLNSVHQSLQTELMTTQALAASQKAQGRSLSEQYDSVQSKIRALNDNEANIVQLTQRVEMLQTNYRSYTNSLEQARIDKALETGQISNVSVVQPALYAPKPKSPQPATLLFVGLALAVIGSLVVGFTSEFLDRSVTTPEQVEQELGIPVLLSVPRSRHPDLLKN